MSIILPIWLIILIVGLPLLSETVYTPVLPEIAHTLHTTAANVEYTLTIYMIGFSLGTLFWGKISDRFGRKTPIILGFLIYLIGCFGCFAAQSIELLMVSRLIQAFGASVGSVLGQAITRDAFEGLALRKIYASVGAALAIFPAIGPTLGSVIAAKWHYPAIFLFLSIVTVILLFIIILKLPETHVIHNRKSISLFDTLFKLLRNQHVLSCMLLVAAWNGITFSYCAEAPFYFIKILQLSPQVYGLTFILTALFAMIGAKISHRLQHVYKPAQIIKLGLIIIFISNGLFLSFILSLYIFHININYYKNIIIFITVANQMILSIGGCIVASNCMAIALVEYKDRIGTASSIFGFLYYFLISLFIGGMGLLHNGTLIPMPSYFLGLAIFMLIILKFLKINDPV